MKLLNSLAKIGYWVLIIIPVLFLVVSTWSYFSVLYTFGEVPLTHDVLEELAEANKLSIHIFPTEYGSFLIATLSICYLSFPVFLLANYFLHKEENIHFHKKFSIMLTAIYASVFLLIQLDAFGWYFICCRLMQ